MQCLWWGWNHIPSISNQALYHWATTLLLEGGLSFIITCEKLLGVPLNFLEVYFNKPIVKY